MLNGLTNQPNINLQNILKITKFQRSRVKPDQVDRIRGDYYEIIKRRPWFRNEENSETQDSIIQVKIIETYYVLITGTLRNGLSVT